MNYRPASIPVPCNLCGSHDHKVVFEPGVAQAGRIVRCRVCSLMFVNPQDRVKLLDYRKRGHGLESGWAPSPTSLELQSHKVRDYREALDLALEKAPGGRVLEVGCGTGPLLRELRQEGMECVGLEPNGHAARMGRERHGLDIRTETLDEVDLPAASFDVVFLLHVIEHFRDPVAELRRIRRLLKPGGLFILETPRFDTLRFRLFRLRKRKLGNPWHLYFFTRKTLRKSLTLAGFDVRSMRIPSRTMSLARLSVAAGKSLRSDRLKSFGQWLAPKRWNRRLAFPLNSRGNVRFHAIADPAMPSPPKEILDYRRPLAEPLPDLIGQVAGSTPHCKRSRDLRRSNTHRRSSHR